MEMKTPYYPILRSYIMEVTRDLISRGVIRQKQGQRLEEIIKTEAQVVMGAISGDIQEILMEMGLSLVSTGASVLENFAREQISGVLNVGKSSLIEFLAEAMGTGKKR